MDLIHYDNNMIEKHFMAHFFCDFEIQENEMSTFELSQSIERYGEINSGDYIGIENTEYGGKILYVRINTKENKVYYNGRTWRGLLTSKILCPDAGKNYLTFAQMPITIMISNLIKRCGLDSIFKVGSVPSQLFSFQFKRYCTLYDGLKDLLNELGCTIQLVFENGMVSINAVAKNNQNELSSYDAEVDVIDNTAGVNHLICLGQGELAARTVYHLYKQFDGSIDTTQRYFGAEEIVEKYDNSNCETLADLIAAGKEKFQEIMQSEQKRDLLYPSGNYKLGDILTKIDERTSIECSTIINKIVFTIEKGQPYEKELITTDYS